MSEVRSADGTTIAFHRTGEGPPLIVVGGALSTGDAAGPLTSLLAPSLTTFAYDRRGRGASGDTSPYAVDREIEDLAALIEEAGGTAFVVGHSSGAALALEAAAHGLSITRLALYEPPFIVDDGRPPLPPDYVERLDELLAAGRRGDAVEYFLTTGVGMPAPLVSQMRRSEPSWPAMEALAHTLPYDGMVVGEHMTGDPLPLDRWASVTIPTLVIDGGASEPWIRHTADALATVLPRARRETLEGQAHGADPEILAPLLISFFTR